jgi:gamma-glutamylcyclotransferase (GGCT)/AIG2-like uncharacterized protein YtfP
MSKSIVGVSTIQNQDSIKLFVYGTLLVGEPNHFVVEPYLLDREPGTISGRMYSVGGFPAVVLSESSNNSIEGEWFTLLPEAIEKADHLEGYRG